MVSTTARPSRFLPLGAALAVGLAIAVAATGCAGAAPAASPPGISARSTGVVASRLSAAVDAGIPGIAARITTESGSVSRVAQASWSREDGRIRDDSQFRMGSNIKPMIAAITLQLVDDGTLQLTDSIDRWLPGAVPDGAHITIRQLLNHTSGLGDYIGDPRILAKEIGADPQPVSPATLLEIGVETPRLGQPGAAYSYSNTNYIALGLILQRATGASVADLLEHRIIRPLSLHDTYLAADGHSRDGKQLADGYEPDAGDLAPLLPAGAPAGTAFSGPARGTHVLVTHLDPSWAFSAAGLVSTQADEGRFLRALLGGRVVSPKSLDLMKATVPEVPGDAKTDRYGLGLEQFNSPCGPVWGHTGGVPGYATENYASADGTRSVSVASTTLFGLHDPSLGAANQRVVDAAVCTMLAKTPPTR